MSDSDSWNQRYVEGTIPWEIGRPDAVLVQAVEQGRLPRGRILEIGCGVGTNARYLAERGWEVVAVDLAAAAVEQARARGGDVDYRVHDILGGPPEGVFDAAFDRGVFHVFGAASDRARFASHVAEALRPGGLWLSLLGSTEGPARDQGPPRRSAREIVEAVEPVLEVVALGRIQFDLHGHQPPAWEGLFRRRLEPAQPST